MIKQKDKGEIITRIVPWSWKIRLSTFVGVFGILWLFLDPLLTLVIDISVIESLGIWGFLALFILSTLATFFVELLNRRREIGNITFIPIVLVLTENGTRHRIQAPIDMQIDIFLSLLIEKYTRQAAPKTLLSVLHIFDVKLSVVREEGTVELAGDKTFREVGLQDSAICYLKGHIKSEYAAFPFG